MQIEFIFNEIKDVSKLYSEDEVYLGTEYCKTIMELLKTELRELKEWKYFGQTGRLGNEEYLISTSTNNYTVTFTIDSHDSKNKIQLMVSIMSTSTLNGDEYDSFLEKLKITIKDILIKEWKMCTWIVDEQSEYLGMQLYPIIFKIENKMRAFVNKVLTFNFGINWTSLNGFDFIVNSQKQNGPNFKREVPDFNNINDILISTTAESLVKILTKTKIYKDTLSINESNYQYFHKLISNNNKDKMFTAICDLREIKKDLWSDVFSEFFDSADELKKHLSYFIKNRNHIAHNKLMTKKAYEKMLEDFQRIEHIFQQANDNFSHKEPSDELIMTLEAIQEENDIEHEYEQNYLYSRIKAETDVGVRFSNEILDLFEEMLLDFYEMLEDSEYFNYAINISPFNYVRITTDKQKLFSVISNADELYNFSIYATFDINDGMGLDSYMNLSAEKSDTTIILETSILYCNGEAHEDPLEGYIVPDMDSFVETDKFQMFIDEIKDFINNDMNPLKGEVETMKFLASKDGGNSPVADFYCCNCNEELVSLNDDLYQYGHCINCGEDNDPMECIKCGSMFPSSEGGLELCGNCYDRFVNE